MKHRTFNKTGLTVSEIGIGTNRFGHNVDQKEVNKILSTCQENAVNFLDTANVWGIDYDSSLEDTNKIRSSIGISANMFTTIGPLSFTFAQDISKATNDETEAFNFRLGTSF